MFIVARIIERIMGKHLEEWLALDSLTGEAKEEAEALLLFNLRESGVNARKRKWHSRTGLLPGPKAKNENI